MHNLPKINPPSSTNNIMSNADWIAAMLANLELQAVSNYTANAKKYRVVHTKLIR